MKKIFSKIFKKKKDFKPVLPLEDRIETKWALQRWIKSLRKQLLIEQDAKKRASILVLLEKYKQDIRLVDMNIPKNK